MKKEVQIDRELPKNGLVREQRTNTERERERERECTDNNNNNNNYLVYRQSTIKLMQALPPTLIPQVLSSYWRGEEARKVIDYILDHPAFLVPAMRQELAIKKATAYQILYNLSPWVKKSDKTVKHPRRGPGSRPHVWLIEGQDLVEGVKKATKFYYESLGLVDPQVKRLEAEKLGLKLIAKLKNREEINYLEILNFLASEGFPGHTRGNFGKIIASFLQGEGYKVWR